MIMGILIMLISSFFVIATSNSKIMGNYKDRQICQQVAEAGLDYAVYKFNENNNWRGDTNFDMSGNGEVTKHLNKVGGTFYITFDPNKPYASFNNLKTKNKMLRTLVPGGYIPPYVAQVIIKATVGETTKYLEANFMREDFYTNNIASEGPIHFEKASLVDITKSQSEESNSRLHSNASVAKAIYIDSAIPVNAHGGVLSTTGLIDANSIPSNDPNTKLYPKSPVQPLGEIDINTIIDKNKSLPNIVQSGEYVIKKNGAAYEVYKNGVRADNELLMGSGTEKWADFDGNGNLVIKKNVYIEGTDKFTIKFEYTNKTLRLYKDTSYNERVIPETASMPWYIKFLGISEALAVGWNGHTEGGDDGNNDFNGPSGGGVTPTPRPTPSGEAADFMFAPEIKFGDANTVTDVGDGTNIPKIYSSSPVDLEGRVTGTGAILSKDEAEIVAENNSRADGVVVMSEKNLTVKVDPMCFFNYKGLFYSNDDIEFKCEHMVIDPNDARKNMAESEITAENTYLIGNFKTGGVFLSQNKYCSDPNDPSILINTPNKSTYFSTDYNYLSILNNIRNYTFRVKLVSVKEI